jgi:hypothetical protein
MHIWWAYVGIAEKRLAKIGDLEKRNTHAWSINSDQDQFILHDSQSLPFTCITNVSNHIPPPKP